MEILGKFNEIQRHQSRSVSSSVHLPLETLVELLSQLAAISLQKLDKFEDGRKNIYFTYRKL